MFTQINIPLPRKNSRKKLGLTARLLDSCQKSVEKLVEDKDVKLDIQRQMLEEYKEMRSAYTTTMTNTLEQLIIANKQREERNQLLRKLILLNKTNNK